MKALPTDKRSWAVWKRAFHIWQQKPHEVAPMSDVQQTCQSCGTVYQGNFCPRCGQSARVERFSFKTAFMLFLDIWGIGNRGMFRSIRDLMLRPGYMIRDYIKGCQSAYFPPFKMFFILATFSLVLTHGFNLSLEEPQANKTEEPFIETKLSDDPVEARTIQYMQKIPKTISALEKKSPSFFSFLLLVLISLPLYLFIRHCPAIPDLRYSEHLVALAYTSNTYSIYRLLADLMPFQLFSSVLNLMAVVMVFIALKQLTGYSKRRLLLYFTLTFLISIFVIAVIAGLVIAVIYWLEK